MQNKTDDIIKTEFINIQKDIFSKKENNDDYCDVEHRKLMSIKTYTSLSDVIVSSSIKELQKSSEFMRKCKFWILIGFGVVMLASILGLAYLLLKSCLFDTTVIIAYISVFMIELLGSIALLTRLVFNNQYESDIIRIINQFFKTYQDLSKEYNPDI